MVHSLNPTCSIVCSVNYTDDIDAVKVKRAASRYNFSFSPQISPTVADTQSSDPHVVELGQAVYSTTVSWHSKCTVAQLQESKPHSKSHLCNHVTQVEK